MRLGITSLVPGFYDAPAFLEAEKSNQTSLDDYAEYCVLATAEDTDRESTERRILRVASFLSPCLAAEPGDGRCVPSALLLQHFLDQQGVWNFTQSGAVMVQFPLESILRPKLFSPENVPGGTYGHAWIVAPPFRVVDLTISRQFYTPHQQRYMSGDLIASDVELRAEPISSEYKEPSKKIRSLFPPISRVAWRVYDQLLSLCNHRTRRRFLSRSRTPHPAVSHLLSCT